MDSLLCHTCLVSDFGGNAEVENFLQTWYFPPAVIIQHITTGTIRVISTTRVTTPVTMHHTPPVITLCPTAITKVTAAAAATVVAIALMQVGLYFLSTNHIRFIQHFVIANNDNINNCLIPMHNIYILLLVSHHCFLGFTFVNDDSIWSMSNKNVKM